MLVALTVCYLFRPDSFAAVTVWPAWMWPILGFVFTLAAFSKKTRRAVWLLCGAWAVFLLGFAEEPKSLVRFGAWPNSEWERARAAGRALRVVSLNCAGGSKQAAGEVALYRPDIVLLQESPSAAETKAVGQELYAGEGGIIVGLDASILVNGEIVESELAPEMRSYFVQGRARLKNGIELEVFSTRLTPPVFRDDLWNPSAWSAHSENRRFRRSQLEPFGVRVRKLPESVPIILGGDMNAPQGDSVFSLLSTRLEDAFPRAGRGWGNTIINDFPALRIDQIWTSRHFEPTAVIAQKTVHSDHRMVICDLLIL